MPLMHSGSKKAFSHNVETEMNHGKPQKQAVAIAYRMAREKAKGGEVMCAHGGPMHCNMGCYANGGDVKNGPTGHEKGVHMATGDMAGVSPAGADARMGDYLGDAEILGEAKEGHKKVLGEMRTMKKPHLYAEGGSTREEDEAWDKKYMSGARQSSRTDIERAKAGAWDKRNMSNARQLSSEEASEVSAEAKRRGAGKNSFGFFAEGGETEAEEMPHGEPDGDEDGLMDGVVHEMMEAVHSRDVAAFKDALMACVADCMMKMKAED